MSTAMEIEYEDLAFVESYQGQKCELERVGGHVFWRQLVNRKIEKLP